MSQQVKSGARANGRALQERAREGEPVEVVREAGECDVAAMRWSGLRHVWGGCSLLLRWCSGWSVLGADKPSCNKGAAVVLEGGELQCVHMHTAAVVVNGDGRCWGALEQAGALSRHSTRMMMAVQSNVGGASAGWTGERAGLNVDSTGC